MEEQNGEVQKNKNISFRCTYLIKDYNDIQIINNDLGDDYINKEIEEKIKILNGVKKEKLVLTKNFSKLGINTVDFIVEGKLTNISSMFNHCSSLKTIEFFCFDTSCVEYLIECFKAAKN